ncbi:ABC transporter ATP-binding protein [Leeuwenhoekiella sp. LLG6367-2.1]|uniref:ABC transporter ATP-binding protein n=1 Tax=Leeuwenhoekiella sp. LLG6367-2.1 TaxID=3160833 RepID=UPI003867FEB4
MKYLNKFLVKYFTTFIYFYKKLKHRLFVRIFLNISVGALDGFGLVMFLPLLEMTGDQSPNTGSKSLGKLDFVVEFIANLGIAFSLLNILIVMTTFFLLKGIASYINSIYAVRVKMYFIRTMRNNLSDMIASMSYKKFVLSDAGRISNTLIGEVARVSQSYETYFGAFQQFILTIVYMGFAFTINPEFALLITVGGLITNVFFRSLYKITKNSSSEITEGSHFYQKLIIQLISNFKYLKATGQLENYTKKLKKTIFYIERHNLKIGKLSSIITSVREPLMIIVVSTVILIQVNLMGGELGAILISLLFFYKAMNSLMQMQTIYNKFLEVSGSQNSMTKFEMELVEAFEIDGVNEIHKFESAIVLQNIKLSYDSKVVLNKINLKINKLETVAFVGESGSGKTTLVNLIAGLMPIDSGSISIDNISFSELNRKSYQKRIGFITQEPVIFNDTIFNNVTFWDEYNEDNLQRFNNAIKQASIYEFVMGLEGLENSTLGNEGVNLSGGQRQRISIARELYKDIDILIMDEATSALDSETEKAIQQSIDNLKGKLTILIVAHRLATIKNADKIVLLNKGSIEDVNNFKGLLQSSLNFKRMAQLQEV